MSLEYVDDTARIELDDAAVALAGEFDAHTAAPLRRTLAAATEADDEVVTVDLGEVTFLDSTTVGLLITTQHRLRDTGRHLRLVRRSPVVERLLAMMGLRGVFGLTEPEP